MKITPIDELKNLFLVEDFYSPELLDRFLVLDHLAVSHTKVDWQDMYPRRNLQIDPGTIYEEMNQYVWDQLPSISKEIEIPLDSCSTAFWLDEEGFCMTPHLDNPGVDISMQLYIADNDSDLGTTFYNPDNTIRYQPAYRLNCGYIMINGPYQHHGLSKPVPKGSYRLSSYSWLNRKV